MRKVAAALPVFAACLWAADFWQSKPFTDWNEKDVQRMLQNSPWSRALSVSVGAPVLPSRSKSGRSRTPGGMGEMDAPGVAPATVGIDGENRDPNGRAPGDSVDIGGGIPPMVVTIRWQSALPVKQALMRYKYGNESGTSPEARKTLEAADPNYVVVVSGILKTLLRGDSENVKKTFLEQSSLLVKGRDPMKPVDFMMRGDKTVDAYFAFSKTTPLTIEDKDVEFATKLGDVAVRQRFHLKDMLLNGKLEL